MSFSLPPSRATFAPMKLITSDALLRSLIPHTLTTVEGETPLILRLAPQLEAAELWLADHFTPVDLLLPLAPDDNVRRLATRLVVLHAYHEAIPSLDLILTPNGFGIVSTTAIAPASRERIERLLAATLRERDNVLDALLARLPRLDGWLATPHAAFFAATLFPTLGLTAHFPPEPDRWLQYLALRQRLLTVEADIADHYLGHDLLRTLRAEVMAHDIADRHRPLLAALRSEELAALRRPDTALDEHRLAHLVGLVRDRPADFPEWHRSPVAQLWSPPVYENKPDDHGYWM